jgi:hypothetical protein
VHAGNKRSSVFIGCFLLCVPDVYRNFVNRHTTNILAFSIL